MPGSFFLQFLSACCPKLLGIYSEITWEEVVGLQGIVYTFRVFVISIWMNFSDIRHLVIIVWLDVPGPLRSDARFLFAVSLQHDVADVFLFFVHNCSYKG